MNLFLIELEDRKKRGQTLLMAFILLSVDSLCALAMLSASLL